jgi:hypothetical protein
MRYGVLLLLVIPLLYAGCTSAISANPIQDVQTGPMGRVVQQGLLDATSNLDQAVQVGALSADDPAPKCFHGFLGQLGIDPAHPVSPAASFTPKVSDLISAGSVLYIRAKQLQKLQGGGVSVPTDCKVLIAQFMLDAAAAQTKALPGGGLLPVLR